MQYADLAVFLERLEETSGRLGMTAILGELLAKVKPEEMEAVVRLLQGAVAPDWEGLEVGLAEKQILKAIAIATGASTKSDEALAKLEKIYHEKGDLGLAAEEALGKLGARKQASLFGPAAQSVQEVFDTIVAIARTTGQGSQDAKQRLLAKLLVDATPREARYITRTVAGRLRLGVADMTFLDALAAWHLGRGVRSVQDMEPQERAAQEELRAKLERAYDLRSDLAVVAKMLATKGPTGVANLGVQVGVPLRPMAAERLKTLPEILEKMEGRVALEYKYDGLRIQAHIPEVGPVRLFSRRMEELTAQFPDVTMALRAAFSKHGAIVEGEAVALDADGRLRPFQDVSRRRGRKTDIAEVAKEIPVTMFLFDLLSFDGEVVLDEPLAERRARLAKLVKEDKGPVRLSVQEVVTDVAAMERFFDAAVEEGAEGMMCKDPRAPYKAGSRGFAWIKFKTDYTEALVDTLDLVAIGAFYGRGRRAGWYGALLMAAYDEEDGKFASVCKLGTGFDDVTLAGLKERFAPYFYSEGIVPGFLKSELTPDVVFSPAIVMEVQAAELTISPVHRAGFRFVKEKTGRAGGIAARFPRFTGRWRTDKSPTQATSVAELVEMFKLQLKTSDERPKAAPRGVRGDVPPASSAEMDS